MPLAIGTCRFSGINFDWKYSKPQEVFSNGILHFSGPVVLYSQANLNALFGLRRAVNERPCGDPSAGGTVFVDYWGPNPSAALITPLQVETTPGVFQAVLYSYTAILSEFTRDEFFQGDIHFGQAEFVLMSTGSPL
jgi:hypothetical protein